MSGDTQRRLAAIVVADVAGFSRLVGQDEEGTLAAFRGHRTELIAPLLDRHGGRIANTAGDSFLIEFPSAVEAVRFAIALQTGLQELNEDTDVDRRIRLRIGINVGDVVAEGDDLLGDGVNVAARLERLSAPGGICISRSTRDQIRDRLDVEMTDLGEVEVKNIARPVRVFSLGFEGGAPDQPSLSAAVEQASPGRMAHPLPDRPSVAVLPFDNVNADEGQKALIKALTGDIIIALSRLTELFVIDQMSSETYAGQTVPARQAAEDLGVRYIVKGGLERAGDRLRVTFQLIDALEGKAVRSERYDRTIEDLFAVRDDITRRIAEAIGISIGSGEQIRLADDQEIDLETWLLMKEAAEFGYQPSPANLRRGRELMEKVVRRAPHLSQAHTWLSVMHRLEVQGGISADPEASMQAAWDAAQRAMELDPYDPGPHTALSNWYIMCGRYDEGVAAIRRGIELAPSMASVVGTGTMVYQYVGEFDEAIRLGRRTARLSPGVPVHFVMAHMGAAQHMSGDLTAAEETYGQILASSPNAHWRGWAMLHLALIREAESDEPAARKLVAEALDVAPYFTQSLIGKASPMKDPTIMNAWMATLGTLGLPAT